MKEIKSWISGHGAIHAMCMAVCIILPLGYVGYTMLLGQGLGELLSNAWLLPLMLCGAMHLMMHRMMGHGHNHTPKQKRLRPDTTSIQSWEVADPVVVEGRDQHFDDRAQRAIGQTERRSGVPLSRQGRFGQKR